MMKCKIAIKIMFLKKIQWYEEVLKMQSDKAECEVIYDPNFIQTDNEWITQWMNKYIHICVNRVKEWENISNNYLWLVEHRIILIFILYFFLYFLNFKNECILYS